MIAVTLSLYAFLFAFIAHTMYLQRRSVYELKEELLLMRKKIDEITQDHPMLVNADLVFSRHLKDINAQLISMDNQLQALENKRDNDGGYQHALRILEMGGDKTEITNSCHLSNAEADLLMNLHAYRRAIKTPS